MGYYEDKIGELGYEVECTFEGSCRVFKAWKGNDAYTIKMPELDPKCNYSTSLESYRFGLFHLRSEVRALGMTRDMGGIVKMVDYKEWEDKFVENHLNYGIGRMNLLVRNYVTGTKWDDTDTGFLINASKKLIFIVDELHQRGLANLDLKNENVIVDQFGNPTIIDLGHSLSNDDIFVGLNLQKKEDVFYLKKMLGSDFKSRRFSRD
ncbi:MAG: serine/threonine-protein kinase [Nanoarchaeota archaeon]|nr:serine/threonine-protein kinase [Nanoarchaeota archaeon]